MARWIKLHCRGCGRKMSYDATVDPDLPKNVARIESSECDKCDKGDFGNETWFDKDGKEVKPEWAI